MKSGLFLMIIIKLEMEVCKALNSLQLEQEHDLSKPIKYQKLQVYFKIILTNFSPVKNEFDKSRFSLPQNRF